MGQDGGSWPELHATPDQEDGKHTMLPTAQTQVINHDRFKQLCHVVCRLAWLCA